MKLTINNLSKAYQKGKLAIDNLSMELGNGMFGLLGPNGAGKTTFMKILATLLEPSSGEVRYDDLVLGKDDQDIRRISGYLPQEYGVYTTLTAREFLNYFATLHGNSGQINWGKRIDELLEQVNLTNVADQRVGDFSGGMRQRLAIAQALLNNPKLLIVDEPTAGLDPTERIRFRNLLGYLSGDRIVILSTHIVDDISSSCNDMALIDKGKIRYRGLPSRFIVKAQESVWATTVAPENVAAIEQDHTIVSSVRHIDGVTIRILGAKNNVMGLPGLQSLAPTLEDAYLLVMAENAVAEVVSL